MAVTAHRLELIVMDGGEKKKFHAMLRKLNMQITPCVDPRLLFRRFTLSKMSDDTKADTGNSTITTMTETPQNETFSH